MPNMEALGFIKYSRNTRDKKVRKPKAYFGKMQEASVGKDTMTGHWEIMGLNIDKPFKVYPDGFPES